MPSWSTHEIELLIREIEKKEVLLKFIYTLGLGVDTVENQMLGRKFQMFLD